MEIKYSRLMQELLFLSAKAGSGSDTHISADKFLYTILEVYNKEIQIEDPKDFEKTSDFIDGLFVDVDQAKAYLLQYMNGEGTKYTISDGNYMKLRIKEAEGITLTEGGELCPEILLECIVQTPNKVISGCLTSSRIKCDRADKSSCPPIAEGGMKGDHAQGKERIAALTRTVKQVHKKLLGCVFGQDNAVGVFTSGYFQAELLSLTDSERTQPVATYLFAGPPGVGKTYLAEKAAEMLGLPFARFDMSEYADRESALEFCGSDKVYKNGNQGNFTAFVAENPKCVVLFDEIEKAHISIIHLFLQMLDAGRIRDSHTDCEISLKNVMMIFTTNAGKQLYENACVGDFSGVSRKVILKALQNDINPVTDAPYFPAAICSRFASGNVVMFNRMSAAALFAIVKKELCRHAENFEAGTGVRVEMDDKVASAILFAEGGYADARTVRSRAQSFFDDELFELFRLMSDRGDGYGIAALEKIRIEVDLPHNVPEIVNLFNYSEKPQALVFASEEVADLCKQSSAECEYLVAADGDTANGYLRNNDVKMVLIDMNYGQNEDCKKYLNIEDIDSGARDFFKHIRSVNGSIPVYLIQTAKHTFDEQELVSFKRQGVRGVLSLCGQGDFSGQLKGICINIHRQHSMSSLSRANKLVTFETAQYLTEGGRTATIKLFDFKTERAVDPEDTNDILGGLSKPDTRFDHIIGAKHAKDELGDFVKYLKNPKKYLGTGAKPPKGVLLYGPPGTGKTMLAKALAGESDITFITAEGNQFLKKYMGEGTERIHQLFRTARKYSPAILFIDEIDAIGAERQNGEGSRGYNALLTALLTEMDGFNDDVSKPVFVLAATNYDVKSGGASSLDAALVRRFDRHIYIDLPGREDRLEYIKQQVESNKAFDISQSMMKSVAVRSVGMSLAQLRSILETALRNMVRQGSTRVEDHVLEEAFETFNGGERKSCDISQLERSAVHEAGHALLCRHEGSTPSYLTVVPRGNQSGYMQYGDVEAKPFYTKKELISRIRTALGGRAAEIVCFGNEDGLSTGASGDLASATAMAERMLCAYGMDEDFGIGVINKDMLSGSELGREVRNAVNKLLSREMANAIDIVSKNREVIDELVKSLMIQSYMTEGEIEQLFKRTVNSTEG